MKKSILVKLTMIAMLFAFAGCGAKDTGSDNSADKGSKVQTIDEVEKTAEENVTADTDDVAEEVLEEETADEVVDEDVEDLEDITEDNE